METIKFTASAEFTSEQVLNFAIAKGWGESSDLSAVDFVREHIKKNLIWIIEQPTREEIKKKHQEAQELELSEYRTELNNIIKID